MILNIMYTYVNRSYDKFKSKLHLFTFLRLYQYLFKIKFKTTQFKLIVLFTN